MKQLFALLILVSSIVSLSSCGGGGSEDPKPDNKMYGVWRVESISRDDVSYNEFYEGTKITFSASSYKITGRPELSPFLPEGNINYDTKKMTQSDGLVINYILTSNEKIELDFNFTGEGYAGGRVSGHWKVTLVK